jgi:SAM-dependent methyltransferase
LPKADPFSPSGRISDYSRIAARYDDTRDLPHDQLAICYDRLIEAGIIPRTGRILDAGCGTGQVSLRLAAIGYQVVGIDVSAAMVSRAQAKVRPGWRANYIVGDARDIRADDSHFDAVVVSKLLQHVEDWQRVCCELIRVVRPGACIIQINDRGAFGNAVRRNFSRRADERGYTGRYLGLNPHADGEGELTAFMQSKGCRPVIVDMSDLSWDLPISYGEALNRIQDKLFAEFWYLPDPVYQELLAATREWVEAQPQGTATIQHLKPYLSVQIFRTPTLL